MVAFAYAILKSNCMCDILITTFWSLLNDENVEEKKCR